MLLSDTTLDICMDLLTDKMNATKNKSVVREYLKAYVELQKLAEYIEEKDKQK